MGYGVLSYERANNNKFIINVVDFRKLWDVRKLI